MNMDFSFGLHLHSAMGTLSFSMEGKWCTHGEALHFFFFYSILFVISWTATEIGMVNSFFCSICLLHQHKRVILPTKFFNDTRQFLPYRKFLYLKKGSQKMVKANMERKEIKKQITQSFKSICIMPQFQWNCAYIIHSHRFFGDFNSWSSYLSSWRSWGSSHQLQKISYLPWGDLKGFACLFACL